MTQLLVSVTDTREALIAADAGADIIDIKNPQTGALGALPLAEIEQIVQAVNGRKLTSATIGDKAMEAESIMYDIAHTVATGVDIVKVGFFGSEHHNACIRALRGIIQQEVRVVAVLFADEAYDFDLLPELERSGFYGVMLDTVKKDGSSLLDYISLKDLRCFVESAKFYKLQSGLAGSLKQEHVPVLAALNPDYLGFRGALCENSERKNPLNYERIDNLYRVLHENNRLPGIQLQMGA
jgi:uncharacterized protein (UPF0264 family)